MIDKYYSCDCEMEALRVDVDIKPYNDTIPYMTFWTFFTYLSSKMSAFMLWKNKIRDFFRVLFTDNVEIGKDVICLTKERTQTLLDDLKKSTGYKPKFYKDRCVCGTYFTDFDTFNLLVVEPDEFEESFIIWMCPNYLMWDKKTKWKRAWKILKDGSWTITSLVLDDKETENIMDYLNTMLKTGWKNNK